MSYEVYTISGAPTPWRVMLALVAKGVDFRTKVLQADKREQKAPAFLALNPRGRVPVLKHGDFLLTESLAILSYLEELHPTPPLFGTSSKERARIWELVSEGNHYLRDGNRALLGPIFSAGRDATDAEVQKGAGAIHEEFKRLEGLLKPSSFVCGDRITAADCVCFPEVRLVLRAIERYPQIMGSLNFQPFNVIFPRLMTWVSRIEELPGYEKTLPPHWRA